MIKEISRDHAAPGAVAPRPARGRRAPARAPPSRSPMEQPGAVFAAIGDFMDAEVKPGGE